VHAQPRFILCHSLNLCATGKKERKKKKREKKERKEREASGRSIHSPVSDSYQSRTVKKGGKESQRGGKEEEKGGKKKGERKKRERER